MFSWRHWAHFTSEYKGNKGQGQVTGLRSWTRHIVIVTSLPLSCADHTSPPVIVVVIVIVIIIVRAD
eukprot:3937346-Rhodomonas_salina.1